MEKFYLNNLPGYGKVFIGVFTALMLAVCFWAMFIVYIELFEEMEDSLAEAVTSEINRTINEHNADLQRQEDAELLAEDSDAVLAPIWDSTFAGAEVRVDSISNVEHFRERDSEMAANVYNDEYDYDAEVADLEENVKLAHVHVNGQTLLFFAIGLVFLFSTASPGVKKIIYALFGPAVLLHAIALTGDGFGEIYEILLYISGSVILLSITVMAACIFLDLRRKPA
ncbi:MAG: hypothetical protein ACOYVF_04750 [Candidatus Zixiibacteriota bacterium]